MKFRIFTKGLYLTVLVAAICAGCGDKASDRAGDRPAETAGGRPAGTADDKSADSAGRKPAATPANSIAANGSSKAFHTSARHAVDRLPAPIDLYVNDFENVFSAVERDSLRRQIEAISKTGSIIFCVVTVDSSMVAPLAIDSFARQIGNHWGVGEKNKNNGVVICFSRAGRRLRIEHGLGIAKVLSNSDTDQIMRSLIFPLFKSGNFFAGVSNGIQAITAVYNRKTAQL